MIVVTLIDPSNGHAHTIQLRQPNTISQISEKIGTIIQGQSSGWCIEQDGTVRIVPDKVLQLSIIIIREEKEDAISS